MILIKRLFAQTALFAFKTCYKFRLCAVNEERNKTEDATITNRCNDM